MGNGCAEKPWYLPETGDGDGGREYCPTCTSGKADLTAEVGLAAKHPRESEHLSPGRRKNRPVGGGGEWYGDIEMKF